MHVLFVASEVAPWIKVGGLGDVVGSLPTALRAIGVDARVCVPAHAHVLGEAPDPQLVETFAIHHHGGSLTAEIYETRLDEVPVYLVAGPPIPPHGIVYTGRPEEEGHRYTFFSLAALELTRRLQPHVDVLHAHDWHAAIAAWTLAQQRNIDPVLKRVASVLTVHNLPYTGQGTGASLDWFGVPGTWDDRLSHELARTPLGLGLLGADAISTVSPGYAREVLTPEHGHGFDRLLRARSGDLTGILNGLDLGRWDPANDPAIGAPFSLEDPSGRARCRQALADELGIDPGLPIVGVVSRLVHQKGIDVAVDALRRLGGGFSAAILGEGDPHLEYEARRLAHDLPERISATIGFDGNLARRIYAGADVLILPSRYEPCGMAQMIAMRYGCVPVACETGGLADTVRDHDLADAPTGFLFAEATAPAAAFALRRAFATRARPDAWKSLIVHSMETDFSWRASARSYVSMYERVVGERRREA